MQSPVLSTKLSGLSTNLYVFASNEVQNMTPSTSGNSVYDGGILRWYYHAQWQYKGEDACKKKLHDVACDTWQRFTEIFQAYQKQLVLLERSICSRSYGHLKINGAVEAKLGICAWHNWIFPAIRGQIWPNLSIFCDRFKFLSGIDTKKWWLTHDVTIRRGKKLLKIMKWEEKTGVEIPLMALFKLSVGAGKLLQKEDREIENWLTRCPKRKVRSFHRVLREICTIWKKRMNEGKLLPCAFLEKRLIERFKYKGLLESDPKHLAWIGTIREFKTLTIGQEKVELDRDLSFQKDQCLFTIKDDPNHLFITGRNEASLGIEEAKHRGSIGIAELPERAELVHYGERFSIREHFPHSLIAYEWKSTIDDWDKEEKKIVGSLCEMVQFMIEERYTPHNLLAAALFFRLGKNPMLRTLITMTREPFFYVTLEKCLFDISHEGVFRFVMKNSGLQEKKEFKFFREVIRRVFINGDKETYFKKLRVNMGIKERKTKCREVSLREEAANLFYCCWDCLQYEHLDANGSKMEEKRFRKILMECYLETEAGGYLFPEIGERAITKFLNK